MDVDSVDQPAQQTKIKGDEHLPRYVGGRLAAVGVQYLRKKCQRGQGPGEVAEGIEEGVHCTISVAGGHSTLDAGL